MNDRSDVKAKLAYKEHLKKTDFYNVQIISSPADIKAEKNGEVYFFEIKMTKQTKNYFGAATMTEWQEAMKNPDNFRFVIAITDDKETHFDFIEFTPDEFLQYSTIPPFKVYFNINLLNNDRFAIRNKAIQASKENLGKLLIFYDELRNDRN